LCKSSASLPDQSSQDVSGCNVIYIQFHLSILPQPQPWDDDLHDKIKCVTSSTSASSATCPNSQLYVRVPFQIITLLQISLLYVEMIPDEVLEEK
jgi:hypothetical protein